MINRRSFVQAVACGAMGGLFFTREQSALANKKISKIGLQLYTVRDEMKKDFEATINRVAAIGFKEVEFAGYFDRTPAQVKAALTNAGLSAPSAHILLRVIKENLQVTIETAKAIGHDYLILAWLSPEERKSIDDYKRLAEDLNRAGEACKKAGIQFGYHNHEFEFEQLNGQVPFDLLLAETDPNLVKIELDLYWTKMANQDPLKYFNAHPGRFPLVHVKDMDNSPKKFFTEVGRGIIDFKRIFAQAQKAGIKHFFVEQDESPGSPFTSIKISYDYLKRLNF